MSGGTAVTGTPRLRHKTQEKRTRHAVVGAGGTTREAQRLEISDTRRAQVYRSDAVYTGEAGDPKRSRIPDSIMPEVGKEWRAGVTWAKLGKKYGYSEGRLRLAYHRWRMAQERENESGT